MAAAPGPRSGSGTPGRSAPGRARRSTRGGPGRWRRSSRAARGGRAPRSGRSGRGCSPPCPPAASPAGRRVMLSSSDRQSPRLSSQAVVRPAMPPPRMTTRRRGTSEGEDGVGGGRLAVAESAGSRSRAVGRVARHPSGRSSSGSPAMSIANRRAMMWMSLSTAARWAASSSRSVTGVGADQAPAVLDAATLDLGPVQLLAGLVHRDHGVVDHVEGTLQLPGVGVDLGQRHQRRPQEGVVPDAAQGVDAGGEELRDRRRRRRSGPSGRGCPASPSRCSRAPGRRPRRRRRTAGRRRRRSGCGG